MSSAAATAAPVATRPLPMKHLSPVVSIIDAASPPTTSDSSHAPDLIILLSWMDAREPHIEKYVRSHHHLFPSSRVLLIRCPLSNILWASQRKKQLAPAMTVIQEAAASVSIPDGASSSPPRVLMHVFSNGGVAMTISLADQLKSQCGIDLPRHVMVLDSCPGYFNFGRVHHAITVGLPRIVSPLVALLLAIAWLATVPFGIPPAPTENARMLNKPAVLGRCTRRAYLYGDADEMVIHADVEDHAGKAAAAGVPITTELFRGGKHVSHVRVDAEKYWRLVTEAWEAR